MKTFYDKSKLVFKPLPTYERFRDVSDQQFGQLSVLGFAGLSDSKRAEWFCECQCGNVVKLKSTRLIADLVHSCGCLSLEALKSGWGRPGNNHDEYVGGQPSPEMRSYNAAKTRCTNPNVKFYYRYGGRGIEFRFNSFGEFLAEVGRRPTLKHTLDRIDNNGHYEKGNVRWATQKENSRNTRRNRVLTLEDRSMNIAEWAEVVLIAAGMIRQRKHRLWCDRCALTLPVGGQCQHRQLVKRLKAWR